MRAAWGIVGSGALLLLAFVVAPASTTRAGAWVRPPGELWMKVGASTAFADEKFANRTVDAAKTFDDGTPVEAGDAIPFDFVTGGRYEFSSVSAEAVYGLLERAEIGVALPLLHTVFENDNDEVEPGTGPGDFRLRAAFQLRRTERIALALFGAWKIPTADVPRSVYAQPLGEGQHDLDLGVAVGWSFWPHGWAQLEAWHRWRHENRELDFDPGDEWHLALEAGWDVTTWLAVAGRVVGMDGTPWTARRFGFEQEITERRLLSIAPSILVDLARWGPEGTTLQIGGAFALAGEDLPVTRELRVGLMTTFTAHNPWTARHREFTSP